MNSSKTLAEDTSDGSWKLTTEAADAGRHQAPAWTPGSAWGRYRLLFVRGSWVLLLVFAQPILWMFAVGVLLGGLGQALRLWSAGILHKRQSLANAGPYAHTRHPLYLGTGLQLVGCCALSGLWWSPLVVLPLFLACYLPTVRSEERFLRSRFGAEHQAYCRRVPLWGWRWSCAAEIAPNPFSWRQVFCNRELETTLVTVLLIGLFAVKLWG